VSGKFVVIEGIDGAGKSTHRDFICQSIQEIHGVRVLKTREPGGTDLAEKIRGLVLHEKMDPHCQVLLAMAARQDHLQHCIRPALSRGEWVVSDRFTDSTSAYQGGGGGVSQAWIDLLTQEITQGFGPDRVYLFDVPAQVAAARRAGRGGAADEFEAQGEDYFERVRQVYLDKAQVNSEVYRRIDATQTLNDIQKLLYKDISSL
jgi:dTMP kinase